MVQNKHEQAVAVEPSPDRTDGEVEGFGFNYIHGGADEGLFYLAVATGRNTLMTTIDRETAVRLADELLTKTGEKRKRQEAHEEDH